MDTGKFELIYEYIHCKGKSTYVAGTVNSEGEATGWVEEMHRAMERGDKPPREKGFVCKASVCPLKRGVPFFSYRKTAS